MAKPDLSRHRSAVYNTSLGSSVSGFKSFSIQAKGFSWTFSHNWDNWGKYTKTVKKRMATILRKRLAEVAQFIAVEAIKRCPHYSGALEQAIRVAEPEVTSLTYRGRIEFSVGVLSDWHSKYDNDVIANLSQIKFQPAYSGPQLASFLHENYDSFIGKTTYGQDRMRRKSAFFGVHVGSHFLTRAYTENRGHINKLVSSRLSPNWVDDSASTPPTTIGNINSLLQSAAVSYNPKGTP